METKAAEPTSNRSYEVFEPYCKWNTEEGQETLDIDLKGFKKEQLKVHTNEKGMLIISGEKPLGKANKWSRFRKEIRLSHDCNSKEIRAKFSQGILSIVIPKSKSKIVTDILANIEGTKLEALKKCAVWGVNIDKRTIIKVAVIVAAVVIVVAIGNQIARLASHVK